jgi:hypothetical protein
MCSHSMSEVVRERGHHHRLRLRAAPAWRRCHRDNALLEPAHFFPSLQPRRRGKDRRRTPRDCHDRRRLNTRLPPGRCRSAARLPRVRELMSAKCRPRAQRCKRQHDQRQRGNDRQGSHYGVHPPAVGMPGVVSGRGLKSAGTGLGRPLSVGVISSCLQPAPPA